MSTVIERTYPATLAITSTSWKGSNSAVSTRSLVRSARAAFTTGTMAECLPRGDGCFVAASVLAHELRPMMKASNTIVIACDFETRIFHRKAPVTKASAARRLR